MPPDPDVIHLFSLFGTISDPAVIELEDGSKFVKVGTKIPIHSDILARVLLSDAVLQPQRTISLYERLLTDNLSGLRVFVLGGLTIVLNVPNHSIEDLTRFNTHYLFYPLSRIEYIPDIDINAWGEISFVPLKDIDFEETNSISGLIKLIGASLIHEWQKIYGTTFTPSKYLVVGQEFLSLKQSITHEIKVTTLFPNS